MEAGHPSSPPFSFGTLLFFFFWRPLCAILSFPPPPSLLGPVFPFFSVRLFSWIIHPPFFFFFPAALFSSCRRPRPPDGFSPRRKKSWASPFFFPLGLFLFFSPSRAPTTSRTERPDVFFLPLSFPCPDLHSGQPKGGSFSLPLFFCQHLSVSKLNGTCGKRGHARRSFLFPLRAEKDSFSLFFSYFCFFFFPEGDHFFTPFFLFSFFLDLERDELFFPFFFFPPSLKVFPFPPPLLEPQSFRWDVFSFPPFFFLRLDPFFSPSRRSVSTFFLRSVILEPPSFLVQFVFAKLSLHLFFFPPPSSHRAQ